MASVTVPAPPAAWTPPPEDADPIPSRGGGFRVKLELVCRDAEGHVTGSWSNEYDQTLLQFAQFVQASFMGVSSGLSFKDTSGTSHTQTGQILAGTPQIAFGTGTTASTFTDYTIQTAAGGTNPVTATVTSISSNTFTVTATWTNSTAGSVSISELAMYVTTTQGMGTESTFALTHDVFTGQNVSVNGTAAATLTFTFT
ncbi:MAG TPA: hypothetical protein VMG99_09045 [Thermoplasmata archaeon]|nr:hypothetical protein [Thermoplasmata archaeon]